MWFHVTTSWDETTVRRCLRVWNHAQYHLALISPQLSKFSFKSSCNHNIEKVYVKVSSPLLTAFTRIMMLQDHCTGNCYKENSLNFIAEVIKYEMYRAKLFQRNILKELISGKWKCSCFQKKRRLCLCSYNAQTNTNKIWKSSLQYLNEVISN